MKGGGTGASGAAAEEKAFENFIIRAQKPTTDFKTALVIL